MLRKPRPINFLLVFSAFLLWGEDLFAQKGLSTSVTTAATDFIASLNAQQQGACMFPFDDSNRTTWNYLPGVRLGVHLNEIDNIQREKLMDMLGVLLSDEGLKKTESIIELEGILGMLEGRGKDDHYRDPGKYAIVFYGKPSDEAPWFFRFEGHHISLNFTVDKNQVVYTPSFFGANPAIVPSGPHKGLEVLKDEQDMARALVHKLNTGQRARRLSQTRRHTISSPPGTGKITLQKFEGIPASALDDNQKKMLFDLVNLYLNRMDKALADKERSKIDESGWDKIYFAWAGGIEKGEKHYYKIQGPTLLIEYDNSQNDGNHIHTVIRDSESDFGEDILADHYKEGGHHR